MWDIVVCCVAYIKQGHIATCMGVRSSAVGTIQHPVKHLCSRLISPVRPTLSKKRKGLVNWLCDCNAMSWMMQPSSKYSRFSVLQATKSWAGPGNEAR